MWRQAAPPASPSTWRAAGGSRQSIVAVELGNNTLGRTFSTDKCQVAGNCPTYSLAPPYSGHESSDPSEPPFPMIATESRPDAFSERLVPARAAALGSRTVGEAGGEKPDHGRPSLPGRPAFVRGEAVPAAADDGGGALALGSCQAALEVPLEQAAQGSSCSQIIAASSSAGDHGRPPLGRPDCGWRVVLQGRIAYAGEVFPGLSWELSNRKSGTVPVFAPRKWDCPPPETGSCFWTSPCFGRG